MWRSRPITRYAAVWTLDWQIKGDCHRISCSYKDLPTSVKLGQLIYVSDGDLTFQVVEIGTEWEIRGMSHR